MGIEGRHFASLREQKNAQSGFENQQRSGHCQEDGAIAGFKKIGEDPGDESEQKGECPKRGLAGNAGGDEGKEQQGQKQRDSIAKVTRSACG